jgi:hypothetical protein
MPALTLSPLLTHAEAIAKIESLSLNVEHHQQGIRVTTSKGERLHKGFKDNLISAVQEAVNTLEESRARSIDALNCHLFDVMSSGRIHFVTRIGTILDTTTGNGKDVPHRVYDIYDSADGRVIVSGSRSLQVAVTEAEAILLERDRSINGGGTGINQGIRS